MSNCISALVHFTETAFAQQFVDFVLFRCACAWLQSALIFDSDVIDAPFGIYKGWGLFLIDHLIMLQSFYFGWFIVKLQFWLSWLTTHHSVTHFILIN